MEIQKPTIGRVVLYRTDGRNDLSYDLPAIITCTSETHPGDYPDGRKNPLPVPESPSTVHLTIFTPGGFGTRTNKSSWAAIHTSDEDFPDAEIMTTGSGSYVEWNVPYYVPYETDRAKRTWRYPEITHDKIEV